MPTPGKLLIDGATGVVLTISAPPAPAFIRILSCQIFASNTTTVELRSGTTVKDKAYLNTSVAYQRDGRDVEAGGYLDCEPGEAFNLNNSAATIAGQLNYCVVGAMPVGGFNQATY